MPLAMMPSPEAVAMAAMLLQQQMQIQQAAPWAGGR